MGPRRHFNYSNVMSTLSVFLVITDGSAFAAALPKGRVKSGTVKDNSLQSNTTSTRPPTDRRC